MTTNSAFNQDKLIINGKDNPSTYQSPNNLGIQYRIKISKKD